MYISSYDFKRDTRDQRDTVHCMSNVIYMSRVMHHGFIMKVNTLAAIAPAECQINARKISGLTQSYCD